MKTFKRILLSLLVLVIIALVAGAVFLSGIRKGGIPQYKGELVATGLGSDVTVYRDERGMISMQRMNMIFISLLDLLQHRRGSGSWILSGGQQQDVFQR